MKYRLKALEGMRISMLGPPELIFYEHMSMNLRDEALFDGEAHIRCAYTPRDKHLVPTDKAFPLSIIFVTFQLYLLPFAFALV